MAYREYAGETEKGVYAGIGSQGLCLQSGMMAEPPQPPLSKLFNALDIMRKASALAGEITDRLCGAQPTGEGSAKESRGADGAFSEIEIAALQFQRMAEQIISDMGRISSRL